MNSLAVSTTLGSLAPWHPHLDVWALMVAIGGGYLLAVRSHARKSGEAPSAKQVLVFLAGVATLWVASDWPIHDISERSLFSVHMGQHLLMSLVAPPLLLLGTPAWLMRAVLRPKPVMAVVRRLARPIPALLIFNGFLAFSHWPTVVDLALEHHPLHLLVHTVLVGTALLMWLPLTSPLLEIPRLSYPGGMLYLFMQSIVPTVPASFLTFSDGPLYRFYAAAPRLWGLGVVTDQRLAGLTMKLVGGFILWGIIAVMFFKWHAMEEREGVDALEFLDLDRDLRRANLTAPGLVRERVGQ
jgi:putative membrane protein